MIQITANDIQPVPSNEYNNNYFLTDCGGYHNFIDYKGLVVDERISRALVLADIKPDMQVLDIGSGRGEATLHTAFRKANAIGLDYSKDAICLASELKCKYKIAGERINLIRGSAIDLPFKKGIIDRALMLDIVEHLHDWELDKLFDRLNDAIKDDGFIIIHTAPNRLFYDHGYPLIRYVLCAMKVPGLEKNLRTYYERRMHVNEQTPHSLYTVLKKAGFEAIIVVSDNTRAESIIKNYAPNNIITSLLLKAIKLQFISRLFSNSIYCVGWKTHSGKRPEKAISLIKHIDSINSDMFKPGSKEEAYEDIITDHVRMSDIGAIGIGWNEQESWPDHPCVRWTTMGSTVFLGNTGKYSALKIKYFAKVDVKINILVNKVVVKTVESRTGYWDTIECNGIGIGVIEVMIDLDKVWVPDKLFGNGDKRMLGIAIEEIWLE